MQIIKNLYCFLCIAFPISASSILINIASNYHPPILSITENIYIKIIWIDRTKKNYNDQLLFATSVNQLSPECFMHIVVYKSNTHGPYVFVSQYLQKKTDLWPKKFTPYYFFSFSEMHIMNTQKSLSFKEHILKTMPTEWNITTSAIPLKQLKGIKSPAVYIEICANSDEEICICLKKIIDYACLYMEDI